MVPILNLEELHKKLEVEERRKKKSSGTKLLTAVEQFQPL